MSLILSSWSGVFFPFSFFLERRGECSIVRGQSYIGGISAALLWKGRGKGLYGFSFLFFFYWFVARGGGGGGKEKGGWGKTCNNGRGNCEKLLEREEGVFYILFAWPAPHTNRLVCWK